MQPRQESNQARLDCVKKEMDEPHFRIGARGRRQSDHAAEVGESGRNPSGKDKDLKIKSPAPSVRDVMLLREENNGKAE